MNEQQRATAAVDGVMVEHIIVDCFEPSSDESAQAPYTVRVAIRPDNSGVELVPDAPSVRERGRALIEARRILQEKADRTETLEDRQMLTQAIINLTREINALP